MNQAECLTRKSLWMNLTELAFDHKEPIYLRIRLNKCLIRKNLRRSLETINSCISVQEPCHSPNISSTDILMKIIYDQTVYSLTYKELSDLYISGIILILIPVLLIFYFQEHCFIHL